MKTSLSKTITLLLILIVAFLFVKLDFHGRYEPVATNKFTSSQTTKEDQPPKPNPLEQEASKDPDTSIAWPISRAQERITKKPFGIKILPQDSPVTPERFSGFHSGTDFEALAGEENMNVPITSSCTGKILRKEFGRGYGGMIVQSCEIDTLPLVVTYGHVSLKSSPVEIGDLVNKGQFLANLGEGFSKDTDGERKHLHLGIHIGTDIVTSGYVSNEANLEQYLNIENLLY